MKKRKLAPDFIKGIAIVLMVYGHLTMVGTRAGFQCDVKGWIYSFHMPLFLMVSGMFFSVDGIFGQKVRQLFLRIGVPYVFFISIYLLGLWVIQHVGIPTSNPPPESISDFLKTVFITSRGGYWFLHSLLLIQFSLLLGNALAGLTREKDAFVSVIISGLLLFGLITAGMLAVKTVVYFIIGIAIQSISGRNLKVPLLVGWGCVFLVWGLDFLLQRNAIRVFSFSEVIWCICILVGLWAFADHFPKTIAIQTLAWIGRNSLSVLVFHSIFVVLLKPLAGWCVGIESSGWLYSIGATILVTALCLVAASVFDRIKISRFLFGSPRCYMPL